MGGFYCPKKKLKLIIFTAPKIFKWPIQYWIVSKPTFPFRQTPEAIYPLIPIEVFATVVISNDSELSLFYSNLGFNGNLMKFCGNVETE